MDTEQFEPIGVAAGRLGLSEGEALALLTGGQLGRHAIRGTELLVESAAVDRACVARILAADRLRELRARGRK